MVPGIYKEWKDAVGRRDLGLRGYRQHTGIHCGKQRPVLLSLDAGRQDRRFFSETGGLLRKKDLESYRPHWVDPVCVSYRGYDVWELPPNGQGLVALMALGMLEQTTPVGHDDVRTIHQQIEALKLAFADGQRYIADPDYAEIPVEEMVSETYLKQRASLIGDRAVVPAYGNPYSGGTVHLCAADEEGTMVSLIQSNYEDFGSGIVVPGTGINLQDRGCNFSLDQSCPNYLAPGKRPYHTIIPGFLTKDEQAVGLLA